MDGWLSGPGAYLRSGAEMAQIFARYPGVVRGLSRLPTSAFNLRLAKPRLPKLNVPAGETPISWLRELTRQGADERYAHIREEAEERLRKELAVIEDKDFPGYFLIVHDMVKFARDKGFSARAGGQRPIRLSATCSGSPRSIPLRSSCLRALPVGHSR